MPRNKMDDLRNHLFATIEGVLDGDIDVGTAKAVAAVAQQINFSAKTEVEFLKLQGKHGMEILPTSSLLSPPKIEEQ